MTFMCYDWREGVIEAELKPKVQILLEQMKLMKAFQFLTFILGTKQNLFAICVFRCPPVVMSYSVESTFEIKKKQAEQEQCECSGQHRRICHPQNTDDEESEENF